MSQKPLSRLFTLVALVTVLPALMGCASFRGGELVERSRADLVTPETRPSASLHFSWLTHGTENVNAREALLPDFLDVLQESDLFSRVGEGDASAEYQLSLSVENTGNRAVAGVTGFLSGLTLFAFPGYAKDVYTMQASVSKGGTLLKEYTYQDHMNSWFQWLMIFFVFTHSTNDTVEETLANMTWNFLYDLQQDQVLATR